MIENNQISKSPNRKIAKSQNASRGIALYPYQRAWVGDPARFCLGVKGRQIGWTFATTLKHVRRRISKGGLTVWVSASERQSLEAIEYIKRHNQAVRQAFEYEEIEFPGIDEKAKQVTYKHNGARILAMPANPDTIRGYSGDVVLDEFAACKDSTNIWRAALPIASRGFSVDVIATPKGQGGKYWELCRDAGVPALGGAERARWQAGVWSVHWCDIQAAVRQGCPISIDEARAAAGDDDYWLQEYCCVFLADAENYIPMELILAAESVEATVELPAGFWDAPHGPLYLGCDIGRKKDRTVFWLDEQVGDVLWTRQVTVLERTPFNVQREFLFALLPHVARAAMDASGLGMQLAEEAAQRFGSKVEAVSFNLENKERMATLAKSQFEERKRRIPAATFIRRAINAVKRYTAPTGHFRFDAERTEAGHADEFWAMALSGAAASGPVLTTEYHVSREPIAAAQMGAW